MNGQEEGGGGLGEDENGDREMVATDWISTCAKIYSELKPSNDGAKDMRKNTIRGELFLYKICPNVYGYGINFLGGENILWFCW